MVIKPTKIYHLENLIWIRFGLTDESALLIAGLIRELDRGYPGKEGIMSQPQTDSPSQELKGMKMILESDLSGSDRDGGYGILFIDDAMIDLILMKDHPLFKKASSYLEERVDF